MIRPCVRSVLLSASMLGLVGCSSVENGLVYHPVRSEAVPLRAGSVFQDIDFRTPDGAVVHARWCPRPGSKGALLYCHGNAGNLEMRGQLVRDLWEGLDESILIFDYPGFGRSEGHPSEAGCYAAADAAYDWLVQTQGLAPDRILLFGESLGGGVAVELASRRTHRALILVKTFTSIPDVAQDHLGGLPVRCLITNRFDNLAKIPLCQRPTFIAQADADRLVPFGHGERLKKASPNATFFTLPGSGHNDPLPPELYSALRRFLAMPERRGEG